MSDALRPVMFGALITLALLAVLPAVLSLALDHWLLNLASNVRVHLAVAALVLAFLAARVGPALVPVLVMLAALGSVAATILLRVGVTDEPFVPGREPDPIGVLAFNVRHDNAAAAPRITEAILAAGVDVVVLLEAAPMAASIEVLRREFPHGVGCPESAREHCGTVLLSRRPLRDVAVYSLSSLSRDRTILATLDHPDGPIRIAAVHLTKPYYDAMQIEELVQLRRLLAPADRSIVLGDFNASVTSRVVLDFMHALGLRTQWSEPRTWPAGLPSVGLAIDHVMVGRELSIGSLEPFGTGLGSNHLGLTARIASDR